MKLLGNLSPYYYSSDLILTLIIGCLVGGAIEGRWGVSPVGAGVRDGPWTDGGKLRGQTKGEGRRGGAPLAGLQRAFIGNKVTENQLLVTLYPCPDASFLATYH